jgi:virginiamycin B lyase
MAAASWLRSLKSVLTRNPSYRRGRLERRCWLEALEDRCVPDGLPSRFREFPVPTPNSLPTAIVAGPNNTIWFSQNGAGSVGEVDNLLTGHITEHPTTGGQHTGAITYVPGGDIWYTETSDGTPDINNVSTIGRRTPGGQVFDYSLSLDGVNDVVGLAPDLSGSGIWFSRYFQPNIGRLNITGDTNWSTSYYSIPEHIYGSVNIVAHASGTVWYTEAHFGRVGKLVPGSGATTSDVFGGTSFRGLALAIDPSASSGYAWTCAEGISAGIVRVNVETGELTQFNTPTPNSRPYSIVAEPGSTGAFWFTERNGNRIGRIMVMPDGHAQINEISIPTPNSDPVTLVVGPDGNLWFVERNANRIGRLVQPQGPPLVNFDFIDGQGHRVPTFNGVAMLNQGEDFDVAATSGFKEDSFQWEMTAPDGTTSLFAGPGFAGPHGKSAQIGTYRVKLTLTDFLGNSTTLTQHLTVQNLPPMVTLGLPSGSGSLDPTFGTGGVATTVTLEDSVSGLVQLTDGRLVSLFITPDGTQGFRFFSPDGSSANRVTFSSLPMSVAAFAVQGNQIVVAGLNGSDLNIARFDEFGNRDIPFGTPNVATGVVGPVQMTVQADGKIVLVGGTSTGLTLSRRNANGTADMTKSLNTPYKLPGAVVVQADEKILVGDFNSAVLRFDSQGFLDLTFGAVIV